MYDLSLKNNFPDWWQKEFGAGLFTFFLSVFIKSIIPVLYLYWLIKKFILGLLLLPVFVFSFFLWSGRTKDSIVHMGILLFPLVKISYLAHTIYTEGEISPKKARLFFFFVTIVLLDVFYLLAKKVSTIMGTGSSSGLLLFPCILAVLFFIVFEVALINGFNLVPLGLFGMARKEEAPVVKESKATKMKRIVQQEREIKESVRANIDYLQSYGRNRAGHLPYSTDDDSIF